MPPKLPKYTVTLEIRTDAPETALKKKATWDVFLFNFKSEDDGYALSNLRVLSVEVAI